MSNFSIDDLPVEYKELWENIKKSANLKLSDNQKETFFDLARPTISLISTFYEMPAGQLPEEMKELFIEMMAIYEANPTPENAKKLHDVITKFNRRGEPESEEAKPEYKKKWIEDTFEKIPEAERNTVLKTAKEKYIDRMEAVPADIPPSGKLLDELGFISRSEKNLLMEAQAAARILTHLEVLDDFKVKTSYQKPDGTFEKDYLDKDFSTRMQRLEHIVEMSVNDIFTQYESKREDINRDQGKSYTVENIKEYTRHICKKNIFLQKARNEALDTLVKCAKELKEKNPKASERITDLLAKLDDRGQLNNRIEANAKQPNKDVSDCLEVQKKASEPLTHDDLKNWIASVEDGRPIKGAIAHRVDQIIKKEDAEKAAEIARLAAGRGRA